MSREMRVIISVLLVLATVTVVITVFDKPKKTEFYIESTLPTSGPPAGSGSLGQLVQYPKRNGNPEIDPPKDHPPLKIIIGANVWTVHYTTKLALDADNAYAEEININREIWLCNCIQKSDQKEELIHEILHAALMESREGLLTGHYTSDENSFVQPMAPVLLQVLRDNQKLTRWLTKSL